MTPEGIPRSKKVAGCLKTDGNGELAGIMKPRQGQLLPGKLPLLLRYRICTVHAVGAGTTCTSIHSDQRDNDGIDRMGSVQIQGLVPKRLCKTSTTTHPVAANTTVLSSHTTTFSHGPKLSITRRIS